MSSLDLDDDEGADPDHGWVLGTELRTRFEAAQFAIKAASGIKEELHVAGSAFAAYMKSTEDRAVIAMIDLVKVDPRDAYEVLRLQKEIAAFADVHKWVSEHMLGGEEARAEHEEMVAAAEQQMEEED